METTLAEIDLRRLGTYVSEDEDLVEFGCGAGRFLGLIGCKSKVGIEVSPLARAASVQNGLRTVASSEELVDASADVVITIHVLEHTLHPLQELVDLRRILRPGGRIVVIVPADDWRVQRQADPSDINHHLYTWTPLLLGHLLTEAGFERPSCSVVHNARPGRITEPLMRLLPWSVMHRVMWATTYVVKRREVHGIAHVPAAPS